MTVIKNNLRNQFFLFAFCAIVLFSAAEGILSRWLGPTYPQFLLSLLSALGSAAAASAFFSRRRQALLEEILYKTTAIRQKKTGPKLWVASPLEIKKVADSLNLLEEQLQHTIGELTRERNLQQGILTSMSEGVIAIDREENILTVNRGARRMLDLGEGPLGGKYLEEVIRVSGLQEFIKGVLRRPAPLHHAEFTLYSPRKMHLDVHGAPLLQPHGQKSGAVTVIHDITRQKEVDEIRKKFVADVSHELKTPVTNIIGFLEAIHEDGLNDKEQAAHFLDIVLRNARRLNDIIEDLLTLSRLEAKETTITLQATDLGGVAERTLADYRLQGEEKKLTIDCDIPVGLTVKGNGRLLEQALGNLLNNAVKYSREGGSIHILAHKEEGFVRLIVKDDGIGIPAADLPRVFERFYRVDKDRARKTGGTGLGLAIVKHIALAHKGRVTVSSEPERGSAFTLFLPEA